ncbi:hypothetical protein I203_105949 [Kwoniella mangroviensis CBS 8507]|uniref:uncharacterized protein n=1 Tax=Kwoniella mangroviensis CBS 8507 TaxID=1296122 RepID=UPI0030407896
MLLFHIVAVVLTSLGVLASPIENHPQRDGQISYNVLTNAERLSRGLGPAMPNSLGKLIPSRAQVESGNAPIQRGVCPSARPVTFLPPPHPLLNNEETIIPGNGSRTATLSLPFPVRIFDKTSSILIVNEQGWVDFDWYASIGANEPLPSDSLPFYSIAPYWSRPLYTDGFYKVTYQLDPGAVAIHWFVRTEFGFPDSSIDFTLYCETQTPGWWYVYYDRVIGIHSGNPATIGAQGTGSLQQPIPDQWTQYSYNKQGAVHNGLRLAFDTNCPGRYHIG